MKISYQIICFILVSLIFVLSETCPENERLVTDKADACENVCLTRMREEPSKKCFNADKGTACACKANLCRNKKGECVKHVGFKELCPPNERYVTKIDNACEDVCPTVATSKATRSCKDPLLISCVCNDKLCRNASGKCLLQH